MNIFEIQNQSNLPRSKKTSETNWKLVSILLAVFILGLFAGNSLKVGSKVHNGQKYDDIRADNFPNMRDGSNCDRCMRYGMNINGNTLDQAITKCKPKSYCQGQM